MGQNASDILELAVHIDEQVQQRTESQLRAFLSVERGVFVG
jgi:hypothetical protein